MIPSFPTRPTARMRALQEPMIPIVGDLVRRHPGTISLGQGVVYYGPPPEAMEQVARFAENPANHKYQPVEGIPELVAAITAKLRDENGIVADSRSSHVVVTAGGNMAFLEAVLAIADVGDEIVLLSPFYFNHEMAVALAGRRPVIVPTDADYQIRPDAIEAAITPRTRAVLTVSPNNPSGAVYPEAALRAVNEICRRRGVYHISDEPYEYFTHDGQRTPHFSPGSLPGSEGHTISLFSLSKAYGFASWRIGYLVVPDHLLVSVKKTQDTNLICPPVVSQHAALGALGAGRDWCREKIAPIADVRQILLGELEALRPLGVAAPPSAGAFYLLLKVPFGRPDTEIVAGLVREHGVAVLPGSAFGLPGGGADGNRYLRVAYGALDKDTVVEGIRRLVRGLADLVENGERA